MSVPILEGNFPNYRKERPRRTSTARDSNANFITTEAAKTWMLMKGQGKPFCALRTYVRKGALRETSARPRDVD
jgi:hypothetical protein